MKTKKCIVSRHLVVAHMPHPEPYGESIVVLENDMTTDVYTDDQGRLYTETNNFKLIQYLKKHESVEEVICLSHQDLHLITLNHQDSIVVYDWLKNEPYDLSLEAVQEFISHAIYQTSHLLMIRIHEEQIGYVGYNIINDFSILNFNLVNQNRLNQAFFHEMMNLITHHVMIKHHTKSFFVSVPNHEDELKQYVIHEGFEIEKIIYFHHQKEILFSLNK
jgi:hypothetical protein